MPDDLDSNSLEYIINHVFLPPKLPNEADKNVEAKASALLNLLETSAKAYQGCLIASKAQWDPSIKMLSMMCDLQNSKSISKEKLSKAIGDMRTGDALALYIGAQNAGLILRQSEEDMVFESFEASPTAAAIMGCQGRLLCSFPGPAIAVSLQKVKDITFRAELASFLEKMNSEELEEAMPKTTKGGSKHIETRDTAHPKFITELLTGILRAIGRPAEVNRIQKRIADDVVWKAANLPWRRSPLWLVVKVALQSTVDRSPIVQSYSQYKAFMVFFMASILQIALEEQLPSDILFIMNAKLSRRTFKMRRRGGIPEFLFKKVSDQVSRTARFLEKRWSQISRSHSTPFKWAPQKLSFGEDTRLSLIKSGSYLAAVMARKPTTATSVRYTPNEKKRDSFKLKTLPKRELTGISGTECHIALADFELWVRESLDGWVAVNIQREEACRELSELIDDYISAGKTTYKSNPESMSIFLLTTMELWVALDRISVNTCKGSLLSEYVPEFPKNLFDHLLLPRYHHMKRLHRVEAYLKKRRSKADLSNPSIFSDTINGKTFAVRYFNISSMHQQLDQTIEMGAKAEREARIAEFERKDEQYDKLIAQAREKQCEFRYGRRGNRYHPWRECDKCELERRARAIRIEVHEWPLPADHHRRMAAVFELKCPKGFSVWRDTTYKILVDILSPHKPSDTSGPPLATLGSYHGLQKYYANPGQRLLWSSRTKSTVQSHYGGVSFPASRSQVCVKNALQYGLYDSVGEGWVDGRVGECDVRDICTFKLPDGPYRKLQYAVNSTLHTANEVISRQCECPEELSLHEYMAFGLLRAGHRLQWMNIVRELRTRTLTFSHEAVNILFTQAVWNTGPPSSDTLNTTRECHTILEDAVFGHALLKELDDMLTSIQANWLEGVSVKTLIWLTTRLLTVANHVDVRSGAFRLLRRARTVTSKWTRQLVTQLQKCEKEDDMKDLQIRALQMAATCRATYDVDHGDLWNVLSSDGDVATLVECAIIIYNNAPAKIDKLSLPTRILLDRDRRLSHSLEDQLRRLVVARKDGLNQCISRVWSGYKPGSPWKCLSAPNDRWMETQTAAKPNTISQRVQYNLLTGQLLIDGLPLGRMTTEYISHPTYIRLFSEKVLDVCPSNVPGMLFQARYKICGHQVDFGMQQGELIIRARTGGKEYELVPHKKLKGDFPTHFLKKHFHWLEVSTRVLEFRPEDDPWTSSLTNWRLSYLGTASRMELGGERMFDIHKQTALMISSVLGRLEYPSYIDISFVPGDETVSARLPRLKLEFFINGKNEIECRQFRGMVVDSDQDIGTLNGLVNRLVMRQKSVRSVIIPYGDVKYERDEGHVNVKIETSAKGLNRVAYHLYNVDTKLGRLVGNDSLASHLYKTYLHAVTAHCLPDILTRRTGTEEALASLKSATTWSFQKLGKEEIQLLKLIMSLTPARVYYPDHLKVMQKIEWKPLSPLAQHDDFHSVVISIFKHASRFHIFRAEDKITKYPKPNGNDFLLGRAAIRNAVFRRDEFGGSILTKLNDSPYAARDIVSGSSEEARVWNVAEAVEHWSPNLAVCPQLISVLEAWGEICGDPDEMGVELGYDRSVLDGKLALAWGYLYNGLRKATKQKNRYQLMFLLSAMAFSGRVDMSITGTLLAFATNPKFRDLDPPLHPLYTLGDGYEPEEAELIELVEEFAIDFESSEEASLPAEYGEDVVLLQHRREETYKENLKSQVESFVSYLSSQWPCLRPSPAGKRTKRLYPLLNVVGAVENVSKIFGSCYKNKEFYEHIKEAQEELDNASPGSGKVLSTYAFRPCVKTRTPSFAKVLLEEILLRDPPDIPEPPNLTSEQPAAAGGEDELKSLLLELEAAHSNEFEKEYAASMLKSFEALEKKSTSPPLELPSVDALSKSITQLECHMHMVFKVIEETLGPRSGFQRLMSLAGLWPSISPISLLQQLASNVSTDISPQWRQVLIAYGEAITMFQRAERLQGYTDRDDDFVREVENPGGQGRDQIAYSDWLLISIENNFLVRPVQAQIASEMITPSSGTNQTLQLNMGEGKSSVIVPIVSAALADGKKLVRVVVLKPLSGQMFRLLVQKLSGLANRRIFYMPFSRSVKLDEAAARSIRDLYQECMEIGGILLVQPEHVLSFKLMGLDQLFAPTGDKEVASILTGCQRWLEENSQDLLDETDAILHVRHELIYTVGDSTPVELSPSRWSIVQEIFSLVQGHIKSIQGGLEVREVPKSFPGSFPITRILESEAGDALFSRVAEDVFAGRLKTVSFRLFPEYIRKLAVRFVTEKEMHEVDSRPLLDYCDKNDISRPTLLLLRGLIAEKILCFALKDKRWRVEYGLDLSRSMLAVPYRAKDCPAPRAEFSHPDVAITLTCLSYYYTGLTDPQLEHCFSILLKSDNPAVEYEIWIKEDNTIPQTLRQLSGVNLVDNEQRTDVIFPRFRHNKSVIDFYLSRVVFPKEAREFPYKLSTSGWDIAETKTHPTTGFSGTNDNRQLLPLSIKQYESQEQLNTNAKVLSYILQPENSYLCAKGENEQRLDVDRLLDKLVEQNPPIQVLLDVGAQVLEKLNFEVARDWLKRVPDSRSKAAVFFGEDDELTVITRDGSQEPLMVSAFAKQMDQCLVYLDEVHTRGTDLKLPNNSRAAVTLGPNLTKDRLVQACMRMRKLGHGQSVIFCAPPEIHQKILTAARKSSADPAKVSDVLRWSMQETFTNTRNSVPIWAKQGISYQYRNVAWKRNDDIEQMKLTMVEPEAQTLEERFGMLRSGKKPFHSGPVLGVRQSEMSSIEENCKKFAITSLHGAQIQEEQERELEVEVEREQQRELPPPKAAKQHNIHQEVTEFVKTGIIDKNSTAFIVAFDSFWKTVAETHRQNDSWTRNLLVTRDFAKTVKQNKGQNSMDDFLQPVSWVVSSVSRHGLLVIMSPYEINELMPEIILYESVIIHMYAPKVTKSMRTFEDLTLCTIPPVPNTWWHTQPILVDQLNIFAGQLYLQDYESYERVCEFLGLYLKDISPEQTDSIRSDGFVENPRDRLRLGMQVHSPFTKSPVLFLRQLMDCRRKGQTYLATHMGQILHGKLLARKDFEYEYGVVDGAENDIEEQLDKGSEGEGEDEDEDDGTGGGVIEWSSEESEDEDQYEREEEGGQYDDDELSEVSDESDDSNNLASVLYDLRF